MKFLLPEFEKAHILVVGDVMLDRYWVGATKNLAGSTCAYCQGRRYRR